MNVNAQEMWDSIADRLAGEVGRMRQLEESGCGDDVLDIVRANCKRDIVSLHQVTLFERDPPSTPPKPSMGEVSRLIGEVGNAHFLCGAFDRHSGERYDIYAKAAQQAEQDLRDYIAWALREAG